MRLVVEAPQAWFQVVCKLFHMSLNLPAASMVIRTTTGDTIINLIVRLQTHMASRIFMGNRLNNRPKRRCITVAPLSKEAMPELALINLNNMELINLHIAMRVLQHNLFRAWYLANP